MIAFQNVHFRHRGTRPVLEGLTLHVAPGEVCGLVGANGAGKTTAISCLLGHLLPEKGSATVDGCLLRGAHAAVRSQVAALLQEAPVDPGLSLSGHAEWLHPWHPRWSDTRCRHLADRFGLPWDRPLGALSGGERRLAAVVLTLCAEPPVLVLDEPAANLDPWSRRKLLEELSDLLADRPDTTVLYSTHLLADLERLGTRAAWLTGGRIAFEVDVATLGSHWRHVTMIFDGPVPEHFTLPGNMPATVRGPVLTGIACFATEEERERFLATAPARVASNPVSLEEIFIHWQERAEEERSSSAAPLRSQPQSLHS